MGILLMSSYIHVRWLLALRVIRLAVIAKYWLLYSLLRVQLFFLLPTQELKLLKRSQTGLSSICLLRFSGLPPFTFFWLKVIVLSQLLGIRQRLAWIFLVSAVVVLRAYYRLFHLARLSPRVSQLYP
jgi:hypothetical protein